MMLIVVVGCKKEITVNFDAGEYGVIVGDATQTKNKNDISYPEVAANEDYVFIGFSPALSELPKRGTVTAKAQYVKAEFRYVETIHVYTGDGTVRVEVGGYLEDDYKVEIPVVGMRSGRVISPMIEIKTTDDVASSIYTINIF